MYPEIEKEVIKKILLPKKEKVIQKIIHFINNESQKLVKDDVEIFVVNFIHDLPFSFKYVALPDNSIIDNKFHNSFLAKIDFNDKGDSQKMNEIILDYASKYENEKLNRSDLFEWVDGWESENKQVEYKFFSDCWLEAKKITNSKMRALLYEHECWSNSFELDDRIFLDQENHLEYLQNKGISIKTYK